MTDPEEEDRKKLEILLARQHRKKKALEIAKKRAEEEAHAKLVEEMGGELVELPASEEEYT
jgi:hypothetical protein